MSGLDVVLNGQRHTLAEGATVADAVAVLTGEDARRVAVARNDEVVPRSAWPRTPLCDGDRLEVVAAIQGGAR